MDARDARSVAGSVVVAALAMDVAVAQLFQTRIAYVGHLDGKVQNLARQRVIAVHRDFIAVDLYDCHRHRTLRRL